MRRHVRSWAARPALLPDFSEASMFNNPLQLHVGVVLISDHLDGESSRPVTPANSVTSPAHQYAIPLRAVLPTLVAMVSYVYCTCIYTYV